MECFVRHKECIFDVVLGKNRCYICVKAFIKTVTGKAFSADAGVYPKSSTPLVFSLFCNERNFMGKLSAGCTTAER